jgi:hypothetical protein
MKLQYLGDSKDSFKWDYHDYLTSKLGYPFLNILLMMTPDDKSNDGKTHPSRFPARDKIIDFCGTLKELRNLDFISELPSRTGSKYVVKLHKPNVYITHQSRTSYFSGVMAEYDQVVLLDPDIGFQPEKRFDEKHVLYSEVDSLLKQISSGSVISVFQHFRRKRFTEDFECIRHHLSEFSIYYATAICWHSLMFVCISKSKETIEKVLRVNRNYSNLLKKTDGSDSREIWVFELGWKVV